MHAVARQLTMTVAAAAVSWAAVGLFTTVEAAPVTVIATLTAAPGKEAALETVLVPLSAAARHEPGCLSCTLLRNNARPGQFFTYEIWDSKAAIDAHMKGAAIIDATPKLQGILGEAPSQTFLTPVP